MKQAAYLPGGFAIIVRMISIFVPHTGQVIFARSFIFFNILKGVTRRTSCNILMSFLLRGSIGQATAYSTDSRSIVGFHDYGNGDSSCGRRNG